METGMVCPIPDAFVGAQMYVKSTPSCFYLLEVEEVSSGGDADSVSGGNVALTASHGPDDRDGIVEGGGVSAHAGPVRRSLRLANRGGNPSRGMPGRVKTLSPHHQPEAHRRPVFPHPAPRPRGPPPGTMSRPDSLHAAEHQGYLRATSMLLRSSSANAYSSTGEIQPLAEKLLHT
ncbi:hypothetical protein K438DRAFT_1988333 [Mycena galopus ATCC 62051]|nr:hypothetical protein K438DRAFT_1988333 [Mycena galopus ATCC 62051]